MARLSRVAENSRTEAPIATLTPRERARLKSLAHPLKPLLHIGKEGVTAASVSAATEALSTRSLLKIRVLEAAPEDARRSGESLARQIPGAEVVQAIGRTVVLYRPRAEEQASPAAEVRG